MKFWASKQEKFARRYVGSGAARYETARVGAKWTAEEATFDAMYSRVRPRSVLDCPVGTGRFIDRYVRDNIEAVGLDLSDDMLAQATIKVPPGSRVRLVKADIFAEADAAKIGKDYDLIVCVRFIYALAKKQLRVLFHTFNDTGARHLLIGVRVWPDSTPRGRYLRWYLWNTEAKRPRLRRRWNRYTPFEGVLHGMLTDAGWEIVERARVLEDQPIGYYLYLLKNVRVAA